MVLNDDHTSEKEAAMPDFEGPEIGQKALLVYVLHDPLYMVSRGI